MRAAEHFRKGGKALAIGQNAEPESTYSNPQLYPQMFPWLFPYGLGGFRNAEMFRKVGELAHKRHLLMYHDKRFQLDPALVNDACSHKIHEGDNG